MRIRLDNRLKANRDPGLENTFRLPNTTNMHTHGASSVHYRIALPCYSSVCVPHDRAV